MTTKKACARNVTRVQGLFFVLILIASIFPLGAYCNARASDGRVNEQSSQASPPSAYARLLRSGGTAVLGATVVVPSVPNTGLSGAVSASEPTRSSDDAVPAALSSYRYVTCHDVDEYNNPSGLTPSFETSDYRACENVEWYTDSGTHALTMKWYYRTGDTSWAFYYEYSSSASLSAGYWLWSTWIFISGYWPSSNPRAWKVEFYDNSVLVSRDYCEITSLNPGDRTMCKDVQSSNPWEPIERTSTFQRGLDTKACAWFRWDNMYYFFEPDHTCHWIEFEWIDPSGGTTRIATYYFDDYYDQGYSYWGWGKSWDSLELSSSTPLGLWTVNVYMDKFLWDGSFPTWYKHFEGPMFTLTFDVTDVQNRAPTLSNGGVTPQRGYPETEFAFAVTYTDPDGDNPGDRKHVYIYNNGWSRYDMSFISGSPQSGMLYRLSLYGFSTGDHNYFFHFNDEHGLEAYFPSDGSYLTFHVDPSPGTPRIRVDPTSLSFDTYSTASLASKEQGKTYKDHLVMEVAFSGLITENLDGYTYVTSPGCIESTEPEEPMLPTKTFLALLPPNCTVQSITVTNIDQVRLPGRYNVALVGQPAITGDGISTSAKIGARSPKAFSAGSCFAGEVATFKGYQVTSLTASAADYLSNSAVLIQNNAMTITLEFDASKQKSKESMYRGTFEDRNEMEGIVVNPDAVDMYALATVASTEAYKYIIVTNDQMSSAFQPLADWKTQKLGSSRIVTVSTIQSQYSGVDTQEKIRNFLKYAYQNWQTQWVLLGGDVEAVPQRGAYGYVMASDGPHEDRNIPCDLYYSDLDGTWDADGDHVYGETTDGVNLYPDLYVGRAPVNTVDEATNFVNKVLTYEQGPPIGYLTKALLIAYWLDSNTNEASLKDYIASNYLSGYTIAKYYESSQGAGVDKNAVINAITSGVGIVNQASHGNEYSVPPFGTSDVDNLQNGQKYFIFYSMACLTNAFDSSDCIAEHFMLNTHGGAVAYIGNSRVGWYYPGSAGNGPGDQYDKEFFNILSQGTEHIGETLARSKVTFISQSGSDGPFRWIHYCLTLLGDPEMIIHTEEFGKSLRVYNDGSAQLVVSDTTARYQSGEPTGWLNANPKSYSVPVGAVPQEVSVTASPTGLSPNTYHAWLQIRSNDGYGQDPCEVPVTLTVRPCIVHLESRCSDGSETNVETITFDSVQYSLPNDVAKAAGTYQATYNTLPDCAFLRWEVSDGVRVSNANSQTTSVTVTAPSGTLRAICIRYYNVHLESIQDNSATGNLGTITFDSVSHNLPADISKPSGAYQATYTPAGDYVFDHWEVTDGISVSSTTANPTTVTAAVPGGTLRAVYRANVRVSVSPPGPVSLAVGESQPFTATASGGTPPYGYAWFLDSVLVEGAVDPSWTFEAVSAGSFEVYAVVTDDVGDSAQSDTISVTVNTVPVVDYVHVWGYPGGLLDPAGSIHVGEMVRFFAGVTDAETVSDQLTVAISYKAQADSVWTTNPAQWESNYGGYWYFDWVVPGDAVLGLYDVMVEVSDVDGGSASLTELGEFTVEAAPNAVPVVEYIHVWGYPGGLLDPAGSISTGQAVRIFAGVTDAETPSDQLSVTIKYKAQSDSVWTSTLAQWEPLYGGYWYYDWVIPGGVSSGLYDVLVEASDPDGGVAVPLTGTGMFNVVKVNTDPTINYVHVWGYPGGLLDPLGSIKTGEMVRIFTGVMDAETASSSLTIKLSYKQQSDSLWTPVSASWEPNYGGYWYYDWVISSGASAGLYDVLVEASDGNGGSASVTEYGEFTVIVFNANSVVNYVHVWGYPGGLLDPAGTINTGESVRIFAGVSDAETASDQLTVTISYKAQADSVWTSIPALWESNYGGYWYYDWVIPGGVSSGLYDVLVEASDPDGGFVSVTEYGEFTVVASNARA